MPRFYGIIVLCPLLLFSGLRLATAQSTQAAPPADPSITAISVLGTVTEIKPDVRQVIVTTAAGNQVTVTLSDVTEFMRIPPGEKTKDKFVKITSADFAQATAYLLAAECQRIGRACQRANFM